MSRSIERRAPRIEPFEQVPLRLHRQLNLAYQSYVLLPQEKHAIERSRRYPFVI